MRILPTSVTTTARVLFAIFIAYKVNFETGVWTALFAFIIFVTFELIANAMSMLLDTINDLSDQANDLRIVLNIIISGQDHQ